MATALARVLEDDLGLETLIICPKNLVPMWEDYRAQCKWIAGKQNLIVTGPCGVGKSWLACALGQKACRDDFSVLYKRVPRMFAELETGRADGRYPRLFRALTKANYGCSWGAA